MSGDAIIGTASVLFSAVTPALAQFKDLSCASATPAWLTVLRLCRIDLFSGAWLHWRRKSFCVLSYGLSKLRSRP